MTSQAPRDERQLERRAALEGHGRRVAVDLDPDLPLRVVRELVGRDAGDARLERDGQSPGLGVDPREARSQAAP